MKKSFANSSHKMGMLHTLQLHKLWMFPPWDIFTTCCKRSCSPLYLVTLIKGTPLPNLSYIENLANTGCGMDVFDTCWVQHAWRCSLSIFTSLAENLGWQDAIEGLALICKENEGNVTKMHKKGGTFCLRHKSIIHSPALLTQSVLASFVLCSVNSL